ncbi:hypothetical protein [Paraburkholderia tropica]|uniref:hypothetical protein n=1 Tax=Paraburkholderia tropica TaxID=92647 RepID=UPI002AB25A5F|nr:hypothetical protein [Paraburkholderia tropica]
MTTTQRRTPTRMRASMEAQALEAVLNGTQWLISPTSGEWQEQDADDRHTAAGRWRDEGRVFAIERSDQILYPQYLFGETSRPIPEVAEILSVFADYAPLRIASWFESTNGLLHGKRPRECLAETPLAVVKAAMDHVVGAVHG